jgi:hypothetical protein
VFSREAGETHRFPALAGREWSRTLSSGPPNWL